MAAVALTAGVVTLGVTKPAAEEVSLEIEVGDVLMDEGQFRAAIAISNSDPLRHELEVWLTLGMFGEGDGWSRRVAEISSQHVAVRSGEELQVTWDEAVAMPEGWYEVTAWARLDGRGGQVFQQTGAAGVQVEEPSLLSRVSQHVSGDRITEVALAIEGGNFATLIGTVTAAVAVQPSFKIDILARESEVPWWSQLAVDTFVVDAEMTGEATAHVALAEGLPLASGSYRVRLELISDGTVVDQVLLVDELVVDPTDPSIRRSEPAVGAVALVSVATSEDWSDPLDRVVTVVAQNLGPFPVDAKFWWLLAAPGDPAPWDFPDGGSFEVIRRLEAFESRTIRLTPSGELRSGLGFELSVWTHTIDDSGESSHSDGVRKNALIDVPLTPGNGE